MNRKPAEILAEHMRSAGAAVVFTGAGMSTESGLPDFRSAQGLWRSKDPRLLATTEAFRSNREEFYAFYRMRIENLWKVTPNAGHRILAEWEKCGFVRAVITQNVDRLHQAAGSTAVTELHGNLREVRCSLCGRSEDSRLLLAKTECAFCGGPLRPSVVLFGESLPEDALGRSESLSSAAPLFLVLGSSLEVSPANWFPSLAKRRGAVLVIINRDSTQLDPLADLVIRSPISEVLTEADSILRAKINRPFRRTAG